MCVEKWHCWFLIVSISKGHNLVYKRKGATLFCTCSSAQPITLVDDWKGIGVDTVCGSTKGSSVIKPSNIQPINHILESCTMDSLMPMPDHINQQNVWQWKGIHSSDNRGSSYLGLSPLDWARMDKDKSKGIAERSTNTNLSKKMSHDQPNHV